MEKKRKKILLGPEHLTDLLHQLNPIVKGILIPIFNEHHFTLAVMNLRKGIMMHYNSSDSEAKKLKKQRDVIRNQVKSLLFSWTVRNQCVMENGFLQS